MKESKLLEMQNKIASLTRVIQQMINELNILSTTVMGTLETVKLMPGYDKAIEFLKKEADKIEKEKKDGVIEQNTK
jgi:prefoldin subunit 5